MTTRAILHTAPISCTWHSKKRGQSTRQTPSSIVFHPFSNLLRLGLSSILLTVTAETYPCYQKAFKQGEEWNIPLHYALLPKADNLAEALRLSESFLGFTPLLLMPAHIFFLEQGEHIVQQQLKRNRKKALIFAPSEEAFQQTLQPNTKKPFSWPILFDDTLIHRFQKLSEIKEDWSLIDLLEDYRKEERLSLILCKNELQQLEITS
ncbi:sugar phosphate nucleotidyltransferase [Magnetococcales bacterium HHB-1]